MCITTEDFLKVIFPGIQAIVVAVTAIWAYRRFRIEKPLHSRIEFNVSCEFWVPGVDIARLASVTITAGNKGNAEHLFKIIGFEIDGISAATLNPWPEYKKTVHFPEGIIKFENVVSPEDEFFFVRPGVTQTFNYAVQIPAHIRYVKIEAFFFYVENGYRHTAQKIYEVK